MRETGPSLRKIRLHYWLDTGWATGEIITDETGRVVDGAPIFKKFIGQLIDEIITRAKQKYELRPLKRIGSDVPR